MFGWSALIDELDTWDAAGLTATFWWRDDDAIEPTKQLDRLLAVAAQLPIALAVISGSAIQALAERLRDCRRITVLCHGWHHKNHGSPTNQTEYPGNRPADDVIKEFRQGRERMSALFGEIFQPVFVPPWHRFDDKFLPLLLQAGLWSISRGGARSSAAKDAGVFEGNVHADLVLWQHPYRFVGARMAIDCLLKHLRGRRLGAFDIDEPTGILTHHSDQDSQAYDFIERLAEVTNAHKAAKWLQSSEIFPRHGPT
jgi:hypothetical protein